MLLEKHVIHFGNYFFHGQCFAFNLLSVFAAQLGESTGDFKNMVDLLYAKLEKTPPNETESEKDNPESYDEFLLSNVKWKNIHTGEITDFPWMVIPFDDVISWGAPLPGKRIE